MCLALDQMYSRPLYWLPMPVLIAVPRRHHRHPVRVRLRVSCSRSEKIGLEQSFCEKVKRRGRTISKSPPSGGVPNEPSAFLLSSKGTRFQLETFVAPGKSLPMGSNGADTFVEVVEAPGCRVAVCSPILREQADINGAPAGVLKSCCLLGSRLRRRRGWRHWR